MPIPDPPWSYPGSGVLEHPSAELTWMSFVERLARFARNGILEMAARVLWYPWQSRGPLTLRYDIQQSAEAVGADLAALAFMYCPTEGATPSEVEFRLLCWEYGSLSTYPENESALAALERAKINRAWRRQLGETPFARVREDNLGDYVRSLWHLSRAQRFAAAPEVSFEDDVLRILLIHDALDARSQDGQRDTFRRLRDAYFGAPVEALLANALSLLSSGCSAPEDLCPGRFDICGGGGALGELARLISRTESSFCALRAAVESEEEKYRRASELVRVFERHPSVELEAVAGSGSKRLYIPSPRELVAALRRVFVEDFILAIHEREGLNARSLLGDAVHAHLEMVIASSSAQALDRARWPLTPIVGSQQPSIADAVWCGDEYGIVIEAKTRITSRAAWDVSSVEALLNAWKRGWKAVAQGESLLKNEATPGLLVRNMGQVPNRWVLAVLVYDEADAERSAFRHVTARWNLLAETGFAAISFMTFRMLEAALDQTTPDQLAPLLIEDWRASAQTPMVQPPEFRRIAPAPRREYLVNAMDRLRRVR